ncbi:hypothetical protein NW757_011925 [Fusarium falciforme]|nr:hypothetical protein NW757_011925 [Fusarium falciforme]
MAQDQAKIITETDDHEIIGYASQPPPEGSAPNHLDQDYVFKSAMETVTRLDELIVKVNNRVHKPIRGAEWLSTDAKDLCDRLVEAKKPVIELVDRIRRDGPPIREEDNSMYLELFGYWNVIDPLISEADKFLGH